MSDSDVPTMPAAPRPIRLRRSESGEHLLFEDPNEAIRNHEFAALQRRVTALEAEIEELRLLVTSSRTRETVTIGRVDPRVE